MNFPDNLQYTKEHEWISINEDTATVGITEFASQELGDIVFIEIETVGQTLSEGDTFGTVEAVKTVSDLFMPVSGEILELNPKLGDSPEIVNQDPYGEGWLVKIKIDSSGSKGELLTAADYRELVS
jgi:glycine cleavage system H protein